MKLPISNLNKIKGLFKRRKASNLHIESMHIKKSLTVYIVNVSLAVLLSCLLSVIVLKGLSLSPLNDIGSNNDSEISDMYVKILNGKRTSQLSDVVVIGIDELISRDDVGNLIKKIGICSSPKAVGMDVVFKDPKMGDENMVYQLRMCDNLVLASLLDSGSNGKYDSIRYSYFVYFIPFNTGSINLDAKTRYEVMRNFRTEFRVKGDTVNSLPMEMIRLADEELYDSLKVTGNKSWIIYYPARLIEVYSGADILNDKVDVTLLDDKYVLLGDVKNNTDCFKTPLGSMPGVMIHAYALNTLLERKIINNSPNYLVWIIAILVCILFTILDLFLREAVAGAKFFIMRICQGVVIISLIVLGVKLLDTSSIYLNIALPMSMIAMALLSNDIIFGITDIYQMIVKQIKKHKKL